MTLYDLAHDVILQGNIRISLWDSKEFDCEKVLYQVDRTDDFSIPRFLREYENHEVAYMFCPGDGFLHIELEAN